MRVAGLTATPYRLDSGHLCEGEGHIFDSVVYEYSIARGIREGFLSPLSSKATKTTIDISGVGKRGGEFIAEQLEAVASEIDIVSGACDEIVAHAGNRRAWLAFCVGVKHAELVRDALRARGVSAEMVLGETDDAERDRIIEDFRAGRITCLVSVMVLSYGFNVPFVDLVALLRPTCSTGLYVQQVGRGTRKADGKSNCMVLDFAGNVRRFGPVDDPLIATKGGGNGEAPTKTCLACHEIVALAATECPCCGYEFPRKAKSLHATKADTAKILSSERRFPTGSQSRTSSSSSTSRNALAQGGISVRTSTPSTNGFAWSTKVLLAKKLRPGGACLPARRCRRRSKKPWNAKMRSPGRRISASSPTAGSGALSPGASTASITT